MVQAEALHSNSGCPDVYPAKPHHGKADQKRPAQGLHTGGHHRQKTTKPDAIMLYGLASIDYSKGAWRRLPVTNQRARSLLCIMQRPLLAKGRHV